MNNSMNETARRREYAGEHVDPRCDPGIAMVIVMMVGLVIIGMGVLAFQLSNTALTQSSRQVRREQLVHLAEHGTDQTMARLTANNGYTAYPSGLATYPGPFTTAQQEKDWVRIAFQHPSIVLETTPQGEYAVLKPDGHNVVYSASWVPSRAAAVAPPRILKVEYLFSSYNAVKAVLTAGNLTISGNPTINGTAGSAHTNGNITVSGNPNTGGLTASGGVASSGNPTPPPAGGKPPQAIPEISPRGMYAQRLDPGNTPNWYDLCPDGTVREPALAPPADQTPCTGEILELDATSDEYRGWKLSGDNWDFGGDASSYSGIYYVYQKSVKVGGNPGKLPGPPWSATILAEATETLPDPPGCPHGFGDIEISGNPRITPFLQGLGLMAGRDLKISGNPEFPVPTLLAAHEQIQVSGNPTIKGSLVAESVCNTSDSPVANNVINGNPTITFNGDLEVTVPTAIRTALWLEL